MSITKPILIVSIYLAASSSYSASFPQAFEKLNDKEVAFACIVAIDRSITEVENSKVDKITFKDKQLQIYKVLKSKMLWKQWIEHNGSASWYEKRKLKTVIKNFSLDELTPPVSYCISYANSIMRDMGHTAASVKCG